SVVVCTYNGARVIRDCLEGLRNLDYPNFEVIVVNDGSNDATAAVLSEYDYRVIVTDNRGLGSARNTGMEAATGEIVAYIDDDASPDPHWLTYLAAAFLSTTHAAVGGPNIAPPGDGGIAEAVANAPGNPTHVLVSDQEAEHIPGCNMAVRRACLQAVGGFDPQFRVAGDDVDLCWRLLGQRPVPASLRTSGGRLPLAPRDAGMVPGDRRASRALGTRDPVDAPAVRLADGCLRRRSSSTPGRRERGPGVLRERTPIRRPGDAQVAWPDGIPPSAPALGAPAWPSDRRPHALAAGSHV